MLHFIMLCFIALCRYCIFYKLKFCSNPVPSTTLSAGFQTAFVHFMCHISLILAIFQTFVLLPYLYKSGIYGATKWFSKNNVMLAVSNRGGKADSFWFTLFHEISHILMEHRREMLVSVEGDDDIEANIMAADMLIPRDKWEFFVNSNCFTIDTIRSFADMVGVLPCIVLGRLHKEMRVPYGKFDRELSAFYRVVLE